MLNVTASVDKRMMGVVGISLMLMLISARKGRVDVIVAARESREEESMFAMVSVMESMLSMGEANAVVDVAVPVAVFWNEDKDVFGEADSGWKALVIIIGLIISLDDDKRTTSREGNDLNMTIFVLSYFVFYIPLNFKFECLVEWLNSQLLMDSMKYSISLVLTTPINSMKEGILYKRLQLWNSSTDQ
jgi:hypothetical protein